MKRFISLALLIGLCASTGFAGTWPDGMTSNTDSTIIIYPGNTNAADFRVYNDNNSNILVHLDAMYSGASTPLAEDLTMHTNSLTYIKYLIGIEGTSYLTNFTYYGNLYYATNINAANIAAGTTISAVNMASGTNMNGTEIRSGTVADARIASTITRDTELVAATNTVITVLDAATNTVTAAYIAADAVVTTGYTNAIAILSNAVPMLASKNSFSGETNAFAVISATDGLFSGQVTVGQTLILDEDAIEFSETADDNFGIESSSWPVTKHTNSVWMGWKASGNGTYGKENCTIGYLAGWNSSGNYNNVLGAGALQTSAGDANNAIGRLALTISAGDQNTAVGDQALYNSPGNQNNAIGALAMVGSAGSLNNAMGYAALNASAGSYNTGVGSSTLVSSPGSYNTAVGYSSMNQSRGTNNTALGASAGSVTGGRNNVFLGADAGEAAGPMTNAIAVGFGAVPLGNNTAVWGNSSILTNRFYGNVGIGTDAPSAPFHVAITNAGGTSVVALGIIDGSEFYTNGVALDIASSGDLAAEITALSNAAPMLAAAINQMSGSMHFYGTTPQLLGTNDDSNITFGTAAQGRRTYQGGGAGISQPYRAAIQDYLPPGNTSAQYTVQIGGTNAWRIDNSGNGYLVGDLDIEGTYKTNGVALDFGSGGGGDAPVTNLIDCADVTSFVTDGTSSDSNAANVASTKYVEEALGARGGGGGSDQALNGYIVGMWGHYSDSNTVVITNGECYANGSYYSITSPVSVDAAVGATEEFWYFYLDDSASTGSAVTVYASTNEPSLDPELNGWYCSTSTADRVLWVQYIDGNDGATFDRSTTQLDGLYVLSNIVTLASDMNPDATWQTPDEDPGSGKMPVNASHARCQITGFDAGPSDCLAYVTTPARATIRGNSGRAALIGAVGYKQVSTIDDVPLDASRDLRVFGEDNDDNTLRLWLMGWRIKR